MAAGKQAGLVDVKVVSFSPTHTAEKFVIPRTAGSSEAGIRFSRPDPAQGMRTAVRHMTEINERLLNELVDAVKGIVRKGAESIAFATSTSSVTSRRTRPGKRSNGCASSPTRATSPSRCTSTVPAATSPMGWRCTTPSGIWCRKASKSRSSCRAWRIRWAPSCSRQPARDSGSHSHIRGS